MVGLQTRDDDINVGLTNTFRRQFLSNTLFDHVNKCQCCKPLLSNILVTDRQPHTATSLKRHALGTSESEADPGHPCAKRRKKKSHLPGPPESGNRWAIYEYHALL